MLKAHKTNKDSPTFLHLWSLGLNLWPYVLDQCFFCVCTWVHTCVHMWVWMLVYLCEFEGQRQRAVLFLRSHPSALVWDSLSPGAGVADYPRLAGLPWHPGTCSLCLPSTDDMGMPPCLAFYTGARDETESLFLWGEHLTLFIPKFCPPPLFSQRNFLPTVK